MATVNLDEAKAHLREIISGLNPGEQRDHRPGRRTVGDVDPVARLYGPARPAPRKTRSTGWLPTLTLRSMTSGSTWNDHACSSTRIRCCGSSGTTRSSATVAKGLIEDPGNRKLVSIASCWEIAIKVGVGKLDLGEPSRSFLPREIAPNGFELMPISLGHATLVEALPHHHRDPFDRLLIAQATAEAVPVVTRGRCFRSARRFSNVVDELPARRWRRSPVPHVTRQLPDLRRADGVT